MFQVKAAIKIMVINVEDRCRSKIESCILG